MPLLLWFKGPDVAPFKYTSVQGINIPKVAAEVQLEPSSVKLNGVVIDYDSSTGYFPFPDLQAVLGEDAGTTPESAIQVTGQPAGEPSGETACACKGVHGFTGDCRSGLQQLA